MNGGRNPIVHLGDFSLGMRNRYNSPLDSDRRAITDGKNIALWERILETRPGYEVVVSSQFPANSTVRYLEQVRFPTNEVSFLLAQVSVSQWAGGVARKNHCCNYYDGKLYVWGGGSTTMDIYTIATRIWSTGTSGGTARTGCTGTVYNGKIYYWGGYDSGQSNLNTIDIYDIAGDSWSTGLAGGTARSGHVAEYYTGKIYFLAGDLESSMPVDIYDIAGNSWSTGLTGGGARTYPASAIVGDVVYVWGGHGEGYWNWMYSYDIGSNTWTELTGGGTARANATMEHYGGSLFIFAGDYESGGTSYACAIMDVYSISGDSYSTGVAGPANRVYHAEAYDGSRYWYQHGGSATYNGTAYNYMVIYDFSTNTWSYGSSGLLYAGLDDGSPAFEEIYDLGEDAGVISVATLNDVSVITEGLDSSPLWWAGCLSDDASDWTNPLAVWISQDGTNWFDISTEVIDKDADQYATLAGGVGARGALLIKSPVPRVKGFDVVFQTVNSAIGVDTASDLTATFDSSGDVIRRDLKGDIVYWVQDSGATGHFECANILIDADDAVDLDPPPGLFGFGMALDSDNNDIYVFGGDDGGSYYDDMYKYDYADEHWSIPTQSGSVPTLAYGAMIYNSVSTQFEHFGGGNGVTLENDMWYYPVSTGAWNKYVAASKPSARYGHCMVFDSSTEKSYVFGGNDGSTPYLNDVQEFDPNAGADGTWYSKTAGATAKEHASAVIKQSTRDVFLFGGYGGSFLSELHKYSISGDSWSALSPTGGPPTARNGACACYDSVNDYVWIFGGYKSASPNELNDLWYYDVSGNTWNQASPTGGPPDARTHARGVYYNGNFIIWGGNDGTSGLNDMWAYNISGNTWTQIGKTLVGIPIDSHGLSAGDTVQIYGTDSYNGTEVLDANTTADMIVIDHTYVAETFDGDEYIRLRPTLGAGNDETDVVEGVTVYYSGGNKSILTITDDGEASGEVTLTDTLTNQTVTAIYGLYIDTDGIRPEPAYADPVDTITQDLAGVSTTVGQVSYRIVIKAAQITTPGDQVRLTLASGETSGVPGMEFKNASIVIRSGDTDDGTTTPTEIEFSSTAKATLRQGGQTAESYWTDYTTAGATDYLVILDFDEDVTYSGQTRLNRIKDGDWLTALEITQGYKHYYKVGDDSYDAQTVSGYTSVNKYGPALYKLEIRNRPSIPSTQYVCYTDGISINVGAYDSLLGIDIDADEPASSSIYYAMSFNGGQTFRVYLASAWHDIIQYSDPNWQYYDGSSWQNATINSQIGALKEALADSDNQMDEAAVEALTETELVGSGCFQAGVTSTLDFAIAMASGGTAATIPFVRTITASCEDAGTTKVKVWRSGAWQDESWTDGTQIGDVPFAQDGQITTSSSYSTADYHVMNGEPGYYFMLSFVNGLTPGTAITRIQMSAPCQPLASIGLGWEEMTLGFLYVDDSDDSIKDYTTEVSDYTETDDSTAWLCNDITEDTPEVMTTDDSILIGNTGKFNQVQLAVHKVYNNKQAATMLAYYWDGDSWESLTIEDNTESSDGKTLSQKGTISFSVPSDWVQNMPYGEFSRGYWIKLMVDATIDIVGITEVRLQPVPNALVKHSFATAWRNRVVMAGRPDATDQTDISRELEEYGWTGGDIHSQRVGGQDNIVALFSAFDRCFVVKPRDWFMLTESSTGFNFARLASITEAPVNNRCIVHAPAGPLGQPAAPGLFFLSVTGAYLVTGIQSDLEWGTGQIKKLGDVNWWQSDPTIRLDLDYLYLACGVYSPRHHCIFWAVPMITDGSTPQTSNNYILVYDIGLETFYPPWDLAFSAICSGFETNANAPGKIGQPVLYAGDSSGQVLKLFEATTDNTAEIDAYATTSLISPYGIDIEAEVDNIFMVGKTSAADDQLDMKIYKEGNNGSPNSIVFKRVGHDDFSTYEAVSDMLRGPDQCKARFFKYRFDMSGPSKIWSIDIKHYPTEEEMDSTYS